jgi:hypothetical protein
VKLAIADPPYYGCSVRLYGDHPEAHVYDTLDGHQQLIDRLCAEFDGWALCMTSNNLRDILPLCPPDARVAAWVKPFHAYKKGVRPAHSWEPVVFSGGRQVATYPEKGQPATTPKDHLAENITLRKGFTGAKPHRFTWWVLDLLGAEPDDDIADLFPGSGAVTEAIDRWRHAEHPTQGSLLVEADRG